MNHVLMQLLRSLSKPFIRGQVRSAAFNMRSLPW